MEYYHVDEPWLRRPADYYPGLGWWHGTQKRQGKVKPHYAFVWPKDGKRGSTRGRWKDILSGEGPDIHVTIGADKNDHMYNRPRRARWSRWTNLDDRGPDGSLPYKPFWLCNARRPEKQYDFRTRTYRRPNGGTWTDARWQAEPNEHFKYPYAFRDQEGEWWEDPMAGHWQ